VVSSGASAPEREPYEPYEEDDRCEDPQKVRSESQPEKEQNYEQCQQDDHFLVLFSLRGVLHDRTSLGLRVERAGG
jgi:hypothetical protein